MKSTKKTRISLPLDLEVVTTDDEVKLSEEKLHKAYMAAFRSIAYAVRSSSSGIKPNIRIDKKTGQVFADIYIKTADDLFDEDDVSSVVQHGLRDMISLSDVLHQNIREGNKDEVQTLKQNIEDRRLEAGVKLLRARQKQGNNSLRLNLGSKTISLEPLEPLNDVFGDEKFEELELTIKAFDRSLFVLTGRGQDKKQYKFKFPVEQFSSAYAALSTDEPVRVRASLRRPLLPQNRNIAIEGSLVEIVDFSPEESLWREILGKMLGFSFFKKLIKEQWVP